MSNLLYDSPELYENIFRTATEVCLEVFQKYLLEAPSSMLDIGCGTGRELVQLSKQYPDCDCVGFDVHPVILDFAQKKNREVVLE